MYTKIASELLTEDGTSLVLSSVAELISTEETLKLPIAQIAMIALVANGEVTPEEKIVFQKIFEEIFNQ